MARYDISQLLDPEMKAVIAHQAANPPDLSIRDPNDLAAIRNAYQTERAYWNEGGPEMAESRDLVIAGPHGDIPLRLHSPANRSEPQPLLVFFHGGGWVVGNLDTHDRIMRALAAASGCKVLGVDYRLSPESKFPVAIEEGVAVFEWLQESAGDIGVRADKLTVGGDSAGANLSLAVLLHFRDQAPSLIKAGLLFYGAYGLRDSASRRKFGGSEDGLSEKDLQFYKTSLIRSPEDLNDPRINLLSNDLQGLPPLFVNAAALDPLLDDSTLLVELARAAGVVCETVIYDGVLHGFLHYGRMLTKARQAIEDSAKWLQPHISMSDVAGSP